MSIWRHFGMHCSAAWLTFDALSAFLQENRADMTLTGFRRSVAGTSVLRPRNARCILLQEEWASKQHHQAYLNFIQNAGVMDKRCLRSWRVPLR